MTQTTPSHVASLTYASMAVPAAGLSVDEPLLLIVWGLSLFALSMALRVWKQTLPRTAARGVRRELANPAL